MRPASDDLAIGQSPAVYPCCTAVGPPLMTISFLSKAACLLAFTALAVLPLRADDSALRERVSFDGDWRFQKGDPEGTGDSLGYPKLKDTLLASTARFLTPAAASPTTGAIPPRHR